jgi:uncharacterized membrane protein YedE/YeeE
MMNVEEINTDFETQSLTETAAVPVKQRSAWYYIRYAIAGVLFGIILVKGEVINWFRIQEMFRFQSFHMYGVIGSAVVTAAIAVKVLQWKHMKSITGTPIVIPERHFQKGQVIGGLLFGFGWALTGACPGPVFALIGSGVTVFLVVLLSAIAGTWVYGALAKRLPH